MLSPVKLRWRQTGNDTYEITLINDDKEVTIPVAKIDIEGDARILHRWNVTLTLTNIELELVGLNDGK